MEGGCACSRYDYEGVDSAAANKLMEHVGSIADSSSKGTKFGDYELASADNFEYKDPIDGSVASKQGLRFVFSDGSRIIFRLSGTGSAGATIRSGPSSKAAVQQKTNSTLMDGLLNPFLATQAASAV